jgi:hypothetical protein
MKQQADTPFRMSLADCLKMDLKWFRTEDRSATLWRSEAAGEIWMVRVSDFPEESLYTLLINDQEAGSFDEWPSRWIRA